MNEISSAHVIILQIGSVDGPTKAGTKLFSFSIYPLGCSAHTEARAHTHTHLYRHAFNEPVKARGEGLGGGGSGAFYVHKQS